MKNSRLFLLFCVCLSLFSFDTINNTVALQNNYYRDKLQGHWYISEVFENDKKIDIDKTPYCENKENITFKESTMVWEEYTYHSKRCFKSITTKNYTVGYVYGSDTGQNALAVINTGNKKWPTKICLLMAVDNNNLHLKIGIISKHFKKEKSTPDNKP